MGVKYNYVVLCLVATFLAFSLASLTFEPLAKLQGHNPPPAPAGVEAKRQELRLDEPIPERFAGWLGGVVQGDFGTTITGVEITDDQISASCGPVHRLRHPGNFEMVSFAWSGSAFPVTATRNIYTTDGEQNYGKIGSSEIDQLYEQAIRTLDDERRIELGQQIDQALWDLMPQLPLYQSTGAHAVRTTLANFGASGFASVIYEDIGYTQ